VASLVSDEHVNIADVSVVTGQKENIAVITATLDVRNATQLARLMTKLDRLPNVREVTRKLG
jgi:GTP pyrophosphokinase